MSTSNAPPNLPFTRRILKADLEALEERLLEQFAHQREYIDERARDMQTELLRGFRS